jgi:crossover junction endodeoxyribonuclease RuvC
LLTAAVPLPVAVIGIDPGSQRTGWGIVRENSGVLALVACGVVCASPSDRTFSARLAFIYHELIAVLGRYKPDEAAVEQVFTAKNATSALKLGQARGVAVAACAACGLSISDYEPTLVKQSLVGTGRAEKEQVAFMVKRLLNARESRWSLDASDALAVALCHLNTRRFTALTVRANQH